MVTSGPTSGWPRSRCRYPPSSTTSRVRRQYCFCAGSTASHSARPARRQHNTKPGGPCASCTRWKVLRRSQVSLPSASGSRAGRPRSLAGGPTTEPPANRLSAFSNGSTGCAPLLLHQAGCLTLFDGRPEHWLVRGQTIAAVIDLHDLQSGDAAMDLAVLALTDEALLPGVLIGYAPTDTQKAAFAALIPFYLQLRRLSGAEWTLRQGNSESAPALLRLADRELPYQSREHHDADVETPGRRTLRGLRSEHPWSAPVRRALHPRRAAKAS